VVLRKKYELDHNQKYISSEFPLEKEKIYLLFIKKSKKLFACGNVIQ